MQEGWKAPIKPGETRGFKSAPPWATSTLLERRGYQATESLKGQFPKGTNFNMAWAWLESGGLGPAVCVAVAVVAGRRFIIDDTGTPHEVAQ